MYLANYIVQCGLASTIGSRWYWNLVHVRDSSYGGADTEKDGLGRFEKEFVGSLKEGEWSYGVDFEVFADFGDGCLDGATVVL